MVTRRPVQLAGAGDQAQGWRPRVNVDARGRKTTLRDPDHRSGDESNRATVLHLDLDHGADGQLVQPIEDAGALPRIEVPDDHRSAALPRLRAGLEPARVREVLG